MIKFVSGNFFDYEADIRINTVNCVGVMGAGVALQFKNRFPDMFEDYSRACSNHEVKPGKPHLWKDNSVFNVTTIINFPTKLHWKDPSEYEYIEKGLVWLKQYLSENSFTNITIPALGCGHGGLDWNRVKILITDFLQDIDSNIFVFEPSSSNSNELSAELEEKLRNENIIILPPNDNSIPKKLLGRTASNYYLKGNKNILSEKTISILSNSKPSEREKNALLTLINEFPNDRFTFLLGFSNSHEIDIVKEVLLKGFRVSIVAPYGLLQLKIRKDLQKIWDYNRIVLLSTVSPQQSWKKHESISAVKLRLKLADITIINTLEFDKLSFIKNELINSKNINFHINYWNEKISFFDEIFAKKIGRKPNTEKPNIDLIMKVIDDIELT